MTDSPELRAPASRQPALQTSSQTAGAVYGITRKDIVRSNFDNGAYLVPAGLGAQNPLHALHLEFAPTCSVLPSAPGRAVQLKVAWPF